jgi:hypothetical protein
METLPIPLTISELAKVVESRFERDKSTHLSKVPAQLAAKALSRLAKTAVEVDVPAKVAIAIRAGKLVRTGGVVRDKAGKIRHLLQDSSTTQSILKSPAIVFMALDIAESALLNEKLKEIQEQLERIEGKIDDLVMSKLHAAFSEVSTLPGYADLKHRETRIHAALSMISEALPLIFNRLDRSLKLIESKAKEYESTEFFLPWSKPNFRDSIFLLVSDTQKDIAFSSALLALRARLQEELKADAAAKATRRELTVFTLAWDESLREILQSRELTQKPKDQKGLGSGLPPRQQLKMEMNDLLSGFVTSLFWPDEDDLHRETVGKCKAALKVSDQMSAAVLLQDALPV